MTDSAVGDYIYNVTCKVTDKNNGSATYKNGESDGIGTMTLRIIAKEGLTVSGTDYTGKYDGDSHGVAATANVAGATIEYSIDGGKTWMTDFPTIKNVGEINVTVKASMANYSDATADYTLKVTPLPLPSPQAAQPRCIMVLAYKA